MYICITNRMPKKTQLIYFLSIKIITNSLSITCVKHFFYSLQRTNPKIAKTIDKVVIEMQSGYSKRTAT